MKEKTLILETNELETNESDANITVSVHYDNDTIVTNDESHQVSLVHINRIINFVNDIFPAIDKEEHHKALKNYGNMLCDELLPVKKKKALIESDADYLILRINENLVHIPFELIFLKDQFLCHKFAVGRVLKKDQIVPLDKRQLKPQLSIWEIQNHTGLNAVSEVNLLQRYVKTKKIGIIHFAGHFHVDPQSPEKSGWKHKDGIFSAKDINKLPDNRPLPNIVFSSACQSDRTNALENLSSVYGIANAFIIAGVKHYIGTFFNIADTTSQSCATLFYKNLLSGDTIGMAMHKARKSLLADQNDLCWIGYHLYGDPRKKYCNSEAKKYESAKKGEANSLENESAKIPIKATIFTIGIIPIIFTIIFISKPNMPIINEYNDNSRTTDGFESYSKTTTLITKKIETMNDAVIAYSVPKSMILKETSLVNLLIDIKKSEQELVSMLIEEKKKKGLKISNFQFESDEIKASCKMKATLKGNNFKIAEVSESIQVMTFNDFSEWKWQIKALKEGRQSLHLSISAIFEINGK